MTIQHARHIMSDYGKVLAESGPPYFFQSKAKLPCSIARIKFAVYRYVIELIRTQQLNKENAESMIVAYTHLGFFVDSDEIAEKMNHMARLKDSVSSGHVEMMEKHKDHIHNFAIRKQYLMQEIQEFISECIAYSKSEQTD